MIKRMLTMFLTICLIFTMLPVGALAVETQMEPASTVESASPSSVADSLMLLSSGSVTTVNTETELVNAMKASGSGDVVALGADISTSNQLTVERSVTLDLNGHALTITALHPQEFPVNGIKIASGVTFTIKDSSTSSAGSLFVQNKMNSSVATRGFGAAINTSEGALVIESGTVTALGADCGAGIGGGDGDDGGTVTISGGSVKATNMSGSNAAVPKSSDGTPLYLTTLTVMGTSPVANAALDDTGHTIKTGGDTYPYGTKDVRTDENGKVYFYLPAATYSVSLKVDGKLYANESVPVTNSSGNAVDLTIFDETRLRAALDKGGVYYLPTDFDGQAGNQPILTQELRIQKDLILDLNGHHLTIIIGSSPGITSNGIKIASGVTLTIRDSSSPSTGKLTVTNQASGSNTGYSTAINTTDGALVIESGTVTATGGGSAAGIGGGYKCSGGAVTISGGTVIATGGNNGGAGIGGGNMGNGGMVVISGGKVKATGQCGAGIGGGDHGTGGTVIISGGTVEAIPGYGSAGIGAGYQDPSEDGGTLTISGGSVKTTNRGNKAADPKSEDNSTQLYLATVTVKGSSPAANAKLDTGHIMKAGSGILYTYGTKDVETDADGKVYLYLPADTYSIALKVGGKLYGSNNVVVKEDNSGVAELTPAKALISITQPAAITGLPNGTEKTASALGLPAAVTLVTDEGNVTASVAWDVDSCAYDPALTTEQTLTVTGTVTLPQDVINLNGVPLTVSVSVTVNGAAVAPSAPSSSKSGDSARTLTDTPTGLTVSGRLSRSATLRVNSFTPARNTTDPALAAIVKRMDSLEDTMIFCADITVLGSYSGPLTLSFEVGEQYNGQTVTLLHAKNGKLITYTTVVKDGIATFTVESLSPFALFAPVTAMDAIGIPKTGDGMRFAALAGLGMVALVLGAVAYTWRQYRKD